MKYSKRFNHVIPLISPRKCENKNEMLKCESKRDDEAMCCIIVWIEMSSSRRFDTKSVQFFEIAAVAVSLSANESRHRRRFCLAANWLIEFESKTNRLCQSISEE